MANLKRKRNSRISKILPVILFLLILSLLLSIITSWPFINIFLPLLIAYISLYIYMKRKSAKIKNERRFKKHDDQTIYHVSNDLSRLDDIAEPHQRRYHVSNTALKRIQNNNFNVDNKKILKKVPVKFSNENQKNLIKARNPFDIIKSADFEKRDDNTMEEILDESGDNLKKDNIKISWRDFYNSNYAKKDNNKISNNDIKQITDTNINMDADDKHVENIEADNVNEENVNNIKSVQKQEEMPEQEKQDESAPEKSSYQEFFLDMDYPNSIDENETKDIVNRLNKLLNKSNSEYTSHSLSSRLKTHLTNFDETNVQEESVKVDSNILDKIFTEKTEPTMAPVSKSSNLKKSVEFIKNKFFKDAFIEDDDNGDFSDEEDMNYQNIENSDELDDDYNDDFDNYEYVVPADILTVPEKDNSNFSEMEDIQNNADKLIDTLASFGVRARVVNISRGPSVTRYEIQPDSGIKVSKIVGLADDIALNLASSGVRIEAPIPGKAAVGIEVPNKEVDVVHLYEIINSPEFNQHKSKLAFAVGMDVGGKIIVGDIQKMPHVLIAGATGSGKSVCINTLITSILYKASPKDVKMIMIDPKVVELNIYNGIPHLLIPVVTDPKKAAGALGWAVEEMERRYSLFAEENVRDIRSYNNSLTEKGQESLPLIIVIIDELADLMMVASNDVEDYICRLAQKARAAGIHLVVATQRPSVDVITGLIKANIPSRIAFSVSSQVDSRTILDMAGAEKLLGRGDMLFYPMGQPKPIRVQGAFVSDREIEDLVDYIRKKYGTAEYSNDVLIKIEQKVSGNIEVSSDSLSDEDEKLLNQAISLVLDHGHASVSFLQRKLKLGYSRAARIIDKMEEMGIVSSGDGSKPRQILITAEEWKELNM